VFSVTNPGLFLCIFADAQNGQEGFLWDIDLADAFHALLPSFCFSSSLRFREMSPP